MSPEKKAGTPPRAPAFKTSETGFTRPAGPRQGRRLPPFAKAPADAAEQGLIPRHKGLGHLVATLSWDAPTGAMPRILFPPGEDPSGFRLDFVAGLHVTVIYGDADAGRVADVVEALLNAGAATVDACNGEALARHEPLDSCWPRFYGECHRAAA